MTKCTLCVDRIYDEAAARADRKPACVMACPTNARLFGDIQDPGVRGVAGDPRARRLRADARVGHAAGQPLPAAPQDRDHGPGEDLERVDNPLKIDGRLPKPALKAPSLDDVTSW